MMILTNPAHSHRNCIGYDIVSHPVKTSKSNMDASGRAESLVESMTARLDGKWGGCLSEYFDLSKSERWSLGMTCERYLQFPKHRQHFQVQLSTWNSGCYLGANADVQSKVSGGEQE